MAPIHLLPHFRTSATEKSVAIFTPREPGHFATSPCNAGECRRRRHQLEGLRGKDLERDTKGTPRGTPGWPMRGAPGRPVDQRGRSGPCSGPVGQSDPGGLVTHFWSFLRVASGQNSPHGESRSLPASAGGRAETVEPCRSNHRRQVRRDGGPPC
jgi:hypothetical protein